MAEVRVGTRIKTTNDGLNAFTCSAVVYVTEKSYDVAGNYSIVTVAYSASITSNILFTGTSRPNAGYLRIVVNGTQKDITMPFNNGVNYGSKICEGSYTQKVNHNTDGSKTVGFSAQIVEGTDERNYGVVWVTTSASSNTQALTTIPRASQPSINTYPSNSPEFTVGDKITIYMNRASSSFTHTVSINIGGTSHQIATGVTNSCSLDTSEYLSEFMALLGSVSSYESTVSVATYNGSTLIGTKTCAYKAKVNTSQYKPTIGSGDIVCSDLNETTGALEASGIYIKGKSNLQAIVPFGVSDSDYVTLASANIKCGSTETTYTLTGKSAVVTFLAEAVDGDSLIITVTDVRGVQDEYEYKLSVIDYVPVSFAETAIRLYRVNTTGVPTEVGECLHYKVTVNCFDGSFGQLANTIALKCKYKTASGAEYSQYIVLGSHTVEAEQGQTLPLGEITTYTFEGNFTGDLFAYTSEYDLILKIEDLLSSAESSSLRLNAGIPVFAWGEDHFDVFGELHVHDRTDPFKYEKIVFNSLSYKSGDVITLVDNYCIFGGFLTNSSKTIAFSIPLPNIIPDGLEVTVEGKVFIRHADGSAYIANDVTLASLGTVTCDYQYNQVRVRVVASEAFSFANNSVLSVTPADTGLTITFSTPNS